MTYSKMCSLVIPLILVLFFCNGCATFSSMQTAKVLTKGQAEIGGGLHFVGIPGASDLDSDFVETANAIPVIEFSGRYGLGANVDIGLKLSSSVSGTVLPDLKWQFLGKEDTKFAMGTGFTFGYSPLFGNEGSLLQLHLPLYLSFHPTDKFAVYLNPKGIVSGAEEDFIGYYGGSLGATFGKKLIVGVETSLFQLVTENSEGIGLPTVQAGLGVKYQF